jgi:Tellurite resistance protein TerB
MELSDLNADERTALVGLVKAVVLSDGRISEDEVQEVEEIVEAFGEEAYRQCLDAFESRFPDEASFQKFLTTIKRPDARELIYGTVLAGAASDAIEGHESELLSWVEKAWNIEVTVVDENGPS